MVTKDYGNCLMSLNDILFNIPQDSGLKNEHVIEKNPLDPTIIELLVIY
jgi:hypothetical protein